MSVAAEPLRTSTLTLALVAFCWLYAWPTFPALNNPNENVRVQMTSALVEDGTYRIDAARARFGPCNDAACVDTRGGREHRPCEGGAPPPGFERHYYSVKAPLGSVLGVPGYALARLVTGGPLPLPRAIWVCRLTGSILPCLALLFLLRRFFARELAESPFARDLGFFVLACGTVLYGYTLLFLSHAASGLFALAAFAALQRASDVGPHATSPRLAAFAGFAASAVTALEYPSFFVTVVLCGYALFALPSLRGRVAFAAGALLPVLLVMHFQHAAFGSPFRPGHLFVENPGFRDFHQRGFFGADALHLDAATRLLVDPKLGLFTTTPWLVLAPLGVARLRDEGRLAAALVPTLALAALYVPVVFLSNWDGGWVIGPRYLCSVIPFAVYLATHGVRALVRVDVRHASLALGLALAGLGTAALPSVYFPHLPPEIRYPLADLFVPLLRDGVAPDHLLGLVGRPGALGMLPLALVWLGGLLVSLRHLPGGAVGLVLRAMPVAFVALAPSLAAPDRPFAVMHAYEFIKSVFPAAG